MEEKRKFLRFECSIPSEVISIEGRRHFVDKTAVLDFSREGLKLCIDFMAPKPGTSTHLKLYIPEKQMVAPLFGKVTWSKFTNNKLEIGLKIEEMQKTSKDEILSWLFPKWIEKEKNKKLENYEMLSKS